MSKVFVIPDIHLKPWMFDEAEEITGKNEFDKIVMLGGTWRMTGIVVIIWICTKKPTMQQ